MAREDEASLVNGYQRALCLVYFMTEKLWKHEWNSLGARLKRHICRLVHIHEC